MIYSTSCFAALFMPPNDPHFVSHFFHLLLIEPLSLMTPNVKQMEGEEPAHLDVCHITSHLNMPVRY